MDRWPGRNSNELMRKNIFAISSFQTHTFELRCVYFQELRGKCQLLKLGFSDEEC